MFKPSVIFEITDACNLKCSFCYESGRRARKAVSLDVFKDVLRKFRPFYLQVTGGEPTMHPGFEAILSLALKKTPVVQFTSNGTLLGKKLPFFASLKRKPIIAVSLDSHSSLHDTIRKRKGLHREIVEVVPDLQRLRIPVGFSTTVFGPGDIPELPDGNVDEVLPLIELSRALAAPINFQPFSPARPETARKLGEMLLGSDSPYITNTPGFRKILATGHGNRCRFNLTNVSVGTDGEPMPTVPGNCYFCRDCRACYYSCVWEPTLLTSTRILSSARHHLRTLVKLRPPKRAAGLG